MYEFHILEVRDREINLMKIIGIYAGHQTCQKYVKNMSKKCQTFCLVFTVARVAQ